MKKTLILIAVAIASVTSADPWYEAHFRELTKDVGELLPEKKWAQSVVPIFGPNAFPIALNKDNLPTIVAGKYGQGRFLAAGEWYYLFEYDGVPFGEAGLKLTENAVKWLTGGKTGPKIACRDKWSVLHQPTTTNVAASELEASSYDIYAFWSDPYEV